MRHGAKAWRPVAMPHPDKSLIRLEKFDPDPTQCARAALVGKVLFLLRFPGAAFLQSAPKLPTAQYCLPLSRHRRLRGKPAHPACSLRSRAGRDNFQGAGAVPAQNRDQGWAASRKPTSYGKREKQAQRERKSTSAQRGTLGQALEKNTSALGGGQRTLKWIKRADAGRRERDTESSRNGDGPGQFSRGPPLRSRATSWSVHGGRRPRTTTESRRGGVPGGAPGCAHAADERLGPAAPQRGGGGAGNGRALRARATTVAAKTGGGIVP